MPRLSFLLALLLSATLLSSGGLRLDPPEGPPVTSHPHRSVGQGTNLKLVTWNIAELGRSKSDAEIELMASVLRGYDVIAVQEVVGKDPAGAEAVARLAAALDRRGADYDYRVSDPTRSSSGSVSERYAFLWRTATVRLRGRPQLLRAYAKTVEREPYSAEFVWERANGDTGGGPPLASPFRLATFHARPRSRRPEREVAKLRRLPTDYADAPLVLLGDFNVVSRHSVFDPWRERGYELALSGQATTLRRELPDDGDAYYREADNILVPTDRMRVLERGILDVVSFCESIYAQAPGRWEGCTGGLDVARGLSDHAPVYVIVEGF